MKNNRRGTEEGKVPPGRLSTLLNVLGAERRRSALRFLKASEHTTHEQLVNHLSHLATRTDADTIRILIHHTDLPKMEDAGLVDYNQETGIIKYQGSAALEGLLRCCERLAA